MNCSNSTSTTLPTGAAMNPVVRSRSLVVAAAFAVSLLVPATAWAHATLVRTTPGNGSVLAKPPSTLRVVFDDPVQVGPGIAAIRNGGATILAGKARIERARTLVLP